MTHLRLASWNCNQGIARKAEMAAALGADVLVLQEVAQAGSIDGHGQVGWTGRLPMKGLGVFARPAIKSEVEPSWDPKREWFLPVRLQPPHDAVVIGVWAMHHRGAEEGNRHGRMLRALQHYEPILASGRGIVIGDLNDNAIWDSSSRPSFRDTRDYLAGLGYVSAYHALSGKAHGRESAASLYWYRHRDRPYLVDHCFLPEAWLPNVLGLTYGSAEDWLAHSDHVPLTLDIDIPTATAMQDTVS